MIIWYSNIYPTVICNVTIGDNILQIPVTYFQMPNLA